MNQRYDYANPAWYQPPQKHPGGDNLTIAVNRQDISTLLGAAKTGALIGAAGAAAAQLHHKTKQDISWQDAAENTAKGAMKVAVAATAAAAVGQMLRPNSLFSTLATLATGTAVMYSLNNSKESSRE